MVRKEGLLAPWKGLTYPLLFASVQSAILFQAYGWTLRQLAAQPQPLPQHQPPAAEPQRQGQASSAASQLPAMAPTLPMPLSTALSSSPPQQHTQQAQSCSSSPGAPTSGSGSGPAPVALHQLHLHHHHHMQEQLGRSVHGPSSITAQVLGWVGVQLGREPPRAAAASTPGPTAGSQSWQMPSQQHAAQPCSTSGAAASGARDDERAAAGQQSGGGGEASCSSRAPQQQGQAGLQLPLPAPQQGPPLPMPSHGFMAGSVAGFAQVFLWSPVELLKLRSQLQTAARGSAGYRNPAALAAQVLRQDGVAGLYRGFTLTVVRDVPSYAIYFWLYHDIAAALSPGLHPEEAPPVTQVVAGGMAGVIAWMPIYPLDVIKTRVQAVAAAEGGGKTWRHYARELYQEAGARAFFRGVSPTLVRAFLMDGASFLGYTTTLRLLGGGGGSGGGAAAANSGSL